MQCGRFHVLAEFEGQKRSCRDQLEKQALRRRLARRAAATRSQGQAEQSGSPADCSSGSSGAGPSGEPALQLQREVRAERFFEALEARAAAAATALAPPPSPWLAGTLPPHSMSAAEQLAALLLQQQQQQQQAPLQQQEQQPRANPGQQLDIETLASQQQLLQQYGSNQSHHSLMALARVMSASTAAALPSPIAPITPPSTDDIVQPQQQAVLPALAQSNLSPLLQTLLALAPGLNTPSQQQPAQLPPLPPPQPPPLLPAQQSLPPLPPQQPLPPLPVPLPLPPVPSLPLQQLSPQLPLQVPAPQSAPGPYTQQLMAQLLSLNQQRLIAQHRAQRSEDDLAALVRAVVQFLTALSGAAPVPPP